MEGDDHQNTNIYSLLTKIIEIATCKVSRVNLKAIFNKYFAIDTKLSYPQAKLIVDCSKKNC